MEGKDGVDPGFFLGGGVQLRNDITTKKKAYDWAIT